MPNARHQNWSDEIWGSASVILVIFMVIFFAYQINHLDHTEQQRFQIVRIDVELNGYTAEVVSDKGRAYLHLTLDQANTLKVGDFICAQYDCYGSGTTGNFHLVKKLEK